MDNQNPQQSTSNTALLPHWHSQEFVDVIAEERERLLGRRQVRTEKKDVEARQGPGGKMLDYVKPGPMYRWLDTHYPGVWSFEVMPETKELAGFIYVLVQLTVVELPTGKQRTVSSWGCDEAIMKKDGTGLQNIPYIKAAETDGLKRCCVKLGAFNDVYTYAEEVVAPTISKEDMNWYIEVVLPQIPADRVFKQINLLMAGTLSIKDVKEMYGRT